MMARIIIYFFALSCICCTTSILNVTDNNYNPHSRNPNLRIDGFYYDTIIMPEQISPSYPRNIGIRPMIMYKDGTVYKMDGVFARTWSKDEPVENLIEELIMEVKYYIENDKFIITFIEIEHRKDIYKH